MFWNAPQSWCKPVIQHSFNAAQDKRACAAGWAGTKHLKLRKILNLKNNKDSVSTSNLHVHCHDYGKKKQIEVTVTWGWWHSHIHVHVQGYTMRGCAIYYTAMCHQTWKGVVFQPRVTTRVWLLDAVKDRVLGCHSAGKKYFSWHFSQPLAAVWSHVQQNLGILQIFK